MRHLISRLREVRPSRRAHVAFAAAALLITLAVVVSTLRDWPSSDHWRTACYVILGILATLWVAHTAHRVQQEIKDFLMERVNSRKQRTDAVVDLCRCAEREFRAVTFFPAVGIRDAPNRVPGVYLHAIEEALSNGVDVTLVSVSCEEAKNYCEEKEFDNDSIEALSWVEERLNELSARFVDQFTWITVPGEAITVNVCHNESAALMYHMSLKDDDGDGFRSTDARIVAVAKGGFDRYRKYHRPSAAYRLELA
jgi:hypothetical protein